jgi:hypothetical protein
MELHFARSESTFGYFEATRNYLSRHGKPIAFYSDKASIFRVNAKDPKSGTGYTQFGRAMGDLNIDIICANGAPAKGRVERAHQTLQDRLQCWSNAAKKTSLAKEPRPTYPCFNGICR